MAFTPMLSYSNDTTDFPNILSLSDERTKLFDTFPEVDRNQKRLYGLRDFRRKLELFRIGPLENLNSKIRQLCKEIDNYEIRNIRKYDNGEISKNKFTTGTEKIATERAKCLYKNYNESPYFKIYDNFLKLYRKEEKRSKFLLNECYSKDSCREGEI